MNPIFPAIIRGIEHALQPRGYIVLVGNTDSHDDVEVSAFESLLQRRVDGFILATGRRGEQQIIEEASAGNVPGVLVNRDSGAGKHPFVSGDEAGGSSLRQHISLSWATATSCTSQARPTSPLHCPDRERSGRRR
jgi:LacI family transcriptional regulator